MKAREIPRERVVMPVEEPDNVELTQGLFAMISATRSLISGLRIEMTRRVKRRAETRALLEMLNLQDGDRVLEVGSNLGGTLKAIRAEAGDKDVELTGVDLRELPEFALKRATESGAILIKEDATATSFESRSFNKIIASHILEHFDAQAGKEDFLRELKRMGTGDADFFIGVPRESHPGLISRINGHRQFFPEVTLLDQYLWGVGLEVVEAWESRKNILVRAKRW